MPIPLWVYPSNLTPAVPLGVKVARSLDEGVREELARGGKVLLLPDASMAADQEWAAHDP